MSRYALVNTGPVWTMTGEPVDGPVIFENETIISVGGNTAGAELIDCQGGCVTPGLIDCHTHAVFAGSRAHEYELRCQGATYEEIAAAGGGILSTVKAVRDSSEDELYEQAFKHLEWMLKLGTTSLEIKSGYGLDLDSELKMLRVIKRLQSDSPMDIRATLLAAHAVPPEFKGRRSEYLDYVINDILPAAAPYVSAVDIFVEIGFFEADDARRLAVAAAAYDVGMRLHVDQLHDGGGAALAGELGAVSADHLEQTSIAGIEALAKAGVPAVLLPGSVYGLGLHKYPDARAMIEAGASVVLATDFNPGSSPTPSLQMVMSLACTQMGMSPAEALAACTSRAAPVLGWESRVGRIEPGMQADLIVWDTANFRDVPYLFGHNHVQQVWKRGACVA